MSNPKFIIAGAALGASTQDPIQNPVAGFMGLGIGAYVGSKFSPKIVREITDVHDTISRGGVSIPKIRIDESKLSSKSLSLDRTAKTISRYTQRIQNAKNKPEAISSMASLVHGMYDSLRQKSGGISLSVNDIEKVLTQSANGLEEKHVRTLVGKMFVGDDKSLNMLRSSMKSVAIDNDKNTGNVTAKYKFTNKALSVKAEEEIRKERITLPSSMTKEARENAIRKHLIEEMNQPDHIAIRQAKNISELSEGNNIALQGDKLIFGTGKSETEMALQKYTESGESSYIIKNGEIHSQPGHNPFGLMKNGDELRNVSGGSISLATSSYGEFTGVTSHIDTNTLRTSLSTPEASLLMSAMTGRKVGDVYGDLSKSTIRHGSSKFIEPTDALLYKSRLTAIDQALYSRDGKFKTKQLQPSELKEATRRFMSENTGMGEEIFETASKNVGQINIGNARDPNSIKRFGLPSSQRGDNRFNRVEDSHYVHGRRTQNFIDILSRDGLDTSHAMRTSEIVSVATAKEGGLTNLMFTLADGASIINRDALRGVEVGEMSKINLGKLDGESLISNNISDAITSFNENGVFPEGIRFRPNETLGIDAYGADIRAPNSADYSILKGVETNKYGETIAHVMSMHKPDSHSSGVVKLFGDTKSVAEKVNRFDIESAAVFSHIDSLFDNMIVDGKINKEAIDYMESKGFAFSTTGKAFADITAEQFSNAFRARKTGPEKLLSRINKKAIKDYAKKYNVAIPNMIIRGGDLKIADSYSDIDKIMSKRIKMIADGVSKEEVDNHTFKTLKDLAESLSVGSDKHKPVYQNEEILSIAKNSIDSATTPEEMSHVARGLSTAYYGIADDKSRETAAMTFSWMNKNPEVATKRASYISEMAQRMSDGDVGADKEFFEALHNAGMQYSRKNKRSPVVATLASSDLGVKRTIAQSGSGASWVVQETGRSVGLNDLIESIGQRDQGYVYELLSRQRQKQAGIDFEKLFTDDYAEARKRIDSAFDSTGSDRIDILKNLFGEHNIEDGIVSVNMSRPHENMKSISIMGYKGPHSGIMLDNDEKNYLPEIDKAKRRLLYHEAALSNIKKKGKESPGMFDEDIRAAEKEYDSAAGSLYNLIKKTNKSVAKNSEKIIVDNGLDALMRPANHISKDISERARTSSGGIGAIFVNDHALRKAGLTLNEVEEGSELTRVFKHQIHDKHGSAIKGYFRLSLYENGETPLLSMMHREPAQGPENIKFADMIYNSGLNKAKQAVAEIPEKKISSRATDLQVMSGDFDGDAMRIAIIKNNTKDMRVLAAEHNNMLEKNKLYMAALNKKSVAPGGNKEAPSSLSMPKANTEGLIASQATKTEAPVNTQLVEILKDSIKRKSRNDEYNLLKEFNVKKDGGSFIFGKGMSEEDQIAFRSRMAVMKARSHLTQETAAKFVEAGLKSAKHGGGDMSDTQAIYKEMGSRRADFSSISSKIKDVATSEFGSNLDSLLDEELQKFNGTDLFKSKKEEFDAIRGQLKDNISYIGDAVEQYGKDAYENSAKHLGTSNGGIEAAAANISGATKKAASHGPLPEEALDATISGVEASIDAKKTIIATIKENKGRVLGGIAGLAAVSMFVGRDDPDMSAPEHSSPLARPQNVLPPIQEETAYITTPFSRNNSTFGSVRINGSSSGPFERNRIDNLLNGNTAGRTTVRYENHNSY